MSLERVRQRWPLFVTLVATTIGTVSLLLGVGLNVSDSAPWGLYRAVPGTAARGALVVACLPTAVAVYGRARGYLSAGICPGGAQPVLKSVGAVAGDVIDLTAERVTVNGRAIFVQPIQDQDSFARPLPRIASGSYRVAEDEVWLFGLSRQSWDSRYFGPVPLAGVHRVARPVLTLRGPRQ